MQGGEDAPLALERYFAEHELSAPLTLCASDVEPFGLGELLALADEECRALEPGDHVVVVWPAYQSLHETARGAGAAVGLVELRHEDGWTLDLDAVRAAVRPRTRAIVVNFPHNPTGAHLTRPQLEELVEIAEDAGAHLVCDEVYRWLEHEPGWRRSRTTRPSATARRASCSR